MEEIMIRLLKKWWIEFWWGKPVDPTPLQIKQVKVVNAQIKRANIKHKHNHKRKAKK